MKGVIIHADGRHINLAAALDAELYAELEATQGHNPRNSPVLRCGGCLGGVHIAHGWVKKNELYFKHNTAGNCNQKLIARRSAPMTDQHKNIVEYHLLTVRQEGHDADTEVPLPGRRGRADLVINGRAVIEAQHSEIRKPAAIERTARYVASGVESVTWFSDWTTDPQWYGHVPGYKAAVPAAAWKSLPRLRTVTAVGPRIIEAVRCGTRAPCRHRKPCDRWIPWTEPWRGLLVDDVALGIADGSMRPFVLGGNVTLLGNRSVALYAGLTGTHLVPYDAGKPKVRPLPPSIEEKCDREPVSDRPMFADIGPRLVWSGFIHNEKHENKLWYDGKVPSQLA